MGGADYAIDYTKSGWQKEVLKITGGRGVDVAYDPVGRIKGAIPSPRVYLKGYPIDCSSVTFSSPTSDALKCVVWGGRALVVGFAGGEIEKVSFVIRRLETILSQDAHRYFRTATAQPSASEARFGHWHLLGFLSRCDIISLSPFSSSPG